MACLLALAHLVHDLFDLVHIAFEESEFHIAKSRDQHSHHLAVFRRCLGLLRTIRHVCDKSWCFDDRFDHRVLCFAGERSALCWIRFAAHGLVGVVHCLHLFRKRGVLVGHGWQDEHQGCGEAG